MKNLKAFFYFTLCLLYVTHSPHIAAVYLLLGLCELTL